MKKLLTIVGARPQFIKSGILSKELEGRYQEILVHTGQHYDENMSAVFFEELNISEPKYNLNIGSHSHALQTAKMMVGIEEIILNEKPDGVLIYGDTNSTVAASLAASKLLIPVFHVEGGIRTHCLDMPEEQNRIVTDHLSSLIFVSTADNLAEAEKEGLGERAYMVGDIMFDSLLHYTQVALKQGKEHHHLQVKPFFEKRHIDDKYYLATFHRPENTDDPKLLEEILYGLNELDHQVVMAVHPRIKSKIESVHTQFNNIYFVEPLPYLSVLFFTKNAIKVITDSGGLHKEAYLHGTPAVTVLRSGWNETAIGGWNHFIRPSREAILQAVNDDHIDWQHHRNEFGDGKACSQIVDLLDRFYADDSLRLY